LLVILYFLCRKCVCGFLLKLFGQLLTILGAISLFEGFWFAFVLILIGISGILYGTWYNFFRAVCPLTICDFWLAVKNALAIAILAVFIITPFVGAVWLGPSLLLIALLLIAVDLQIIGNQNAGQC